MTVIRFTAPEPVVNADDGSRLAGCPHERDTPISRAMETTHQALSARERQAVRQFALKMAEKMLQDAELNQAAPFVVDKIVRLLVSESR